MKRLGFKGSDQMDNLIFMRALVFGEFLDSKILQVYPSIILQETPKIYFLKLIPLCNKK